MIKSEIEILIRVLEKKRKTKGGLEAIYCFHLVIYHFLLYSQQIVPNAV